ncbi:MAG TPA: alpha/beta hydrolase [Flavitalea sp.]|nr:alpha/beta hydrolase [Flavitalea sp.]
MQNIALAFSALMMFSACSKTAPSITTDPSAKTLMNVSYGNDSKQKLDLYLPQDRSKTTTKMVVLIHGGGWTTGDKNELTASVQELQKRLPGYAFANINYRLFANDQNKFPAQENDVLSAVKFLITKGGEYNYSREFIFIGASAGAHLALLQAYKHTEVIQPKAVISFFGPTDLIDLYKNPLNAGIPYLLNSLTGSVPSQNPTVYQQSSPIYFVNAGSAPTLLLHGEKDDLVPKNQAILLRNKLQSVNVSSKLVLYPNEGHGWSGTNLSNSFDEIADFLKLHVD